MTLAKNSLEGKAEAYLQRIENLLDEAESAKGKYMAECKERREDIKEIYTEAKENGVAVKALKGLVKYRQLEKKQNAISDGLDIDEAAAYQQLVDALGELGAAAAQRAGYGDDNRDLRGNQQQQTEKEREDAANLAKVGRGQATH
jgi:uncharacterized protein (UPF0335 family)